jgi:hypothetical protein
LEIYDFADTCALTEGEMLELIRGDASYSSLNKLRRGIELIGLSGDRTPTDASEGSGAKVEGPDLGPTKDKASNSVPAEKWVYTSLEDVGHAIHDVADHLERLRRTIQRSNEIGGKDSPIGPIHRKMLLAMIEAMLIELTQPYVEQRRVRGFFKSIWGLMKKGIEKGVSDEISEAVRGAIGAGMELGKRLMDAPGSGSASDIPPDMIDV